MFKKYGVGMMTILLVIIIFIMIFNSATREGFTWSKKQVSDFLKYENTVYPNTQFNLNVLQSQASPEEVDTLLKTGYWPWDETTKYLYMDSIAHNPIIQINPAESLDDSMKLYNNEAMKRKLAYNAKEGEFLIYGGLIGNSPTMPNNIQNTIMCENGKMKKTVFNGYNLMSGYKNSRNSDVSNEDIPNIMPGFHFIKEPCNPCSNLEGDYSCPFTLNVGSDSTTSPIWAERWSINKSA